MRAILALEDGSWFEGESFGATTPKTGEICFNTSMTGYQEVLTDPSYRGQIVAMTYPLIGNYGINPLDNESSGPHVRGFVIGELCRHPSNYRATESLHDYLARHDIPGVEGIDTRALTKILRTSGAMRAILTTEPITPEAACRKAAQSPPMLGADFVQEVTTPGRYEWDDGMPAPAPPASREWTIPNPSQPDLLDHEGVDVFRPLPPATRHIVAYDFGVKFNILRRLRQEGFRITVVNARTPAKDVLALKPDGVFLSNGPGDPAALSPIHKEISELLPRLPVFAICLGHQILAHAVGGRTYKLKFGHRGGNQPVLCLRDRRVAITSQNHGFAVDAESLPGNVEVSHINLNDQTVEGLRHKDYPAFSVQYHPEAAPGPNDARHFFREFAALIDTWKT